MANTYKKYFEESKLYKDFNSVDIKLRFKLGKQPKCEMFDFYILHPKL